MGYVDAYCSPVLGDPPKNNRPLEERHSTNNTARPYFISCCEESYFLVSVLDLSGKAYNKGCFEPMKNIFSVLETRNQDLSFDIYINYQTLPEITRNYYLLAEGQINLVQILL